jgi:carotenoid cleavage dioxygenase
VGSYYRAAADPQYPPRSGHDIFINGDGIVHKVRFENGHADLSTRYVRTAKLMAERHSRRALFGAYRNPYTDDPSVAGVDNGTANTAMLWHGGRLFALKESSLPVQLDPETLATLGPCDFAGALPGKTFTAHPKRDPETGELLAFAYNSSGLPDRDIRVLWISPTGQLTRSEVFQAPYSSMVHDFMVSRNYIAFALSPMLTDVERLKRHESYWYWDSHETAHVAIIPRAAGVKGIRWYRAPTTMETHTFNAWEEGPTLHLEHFVNQSGWLSLFPDIRKPDAKETPPHAERWSFDLASSSSGFRIARIFEQFGEMPQVDPRYLMRRARNYFFGTFNPQLGPMLEWGPKGPPFTCIGRFDERTGKTSYFYAGPHSAPEEPVFVPKSPGSPEGDGWLLTMVGRRAENRTDMVILDALNLEAGPVALIKFPCRLHEGFHGTFVRAD